MNRSLDEKREAWYNDFILDKRMGEYILTNLEQNPNESIDELLRAVLSLKDMEECRAFFSDLCTMQELLTFAQRVQVAKLLMTGETYDSIKSQVSVSSATITRISTALKFGTGGYRTVLERNT